jgi:polygalacturonase
MFYLLLGFVKAITFDIEAYGAIGDGVTDSTDAIRLACEACRDAGWW